MVNCVYLNQGPPPVPNSADVNGDCLINPVDVVLLVQYVYLGTGTLVSGCVDE